VRSEEFWGVALQRTFLEAALRSRNAGQKPCFQRLMTAPQAHKMPNVSRQIHKADPIAVAKGDATIDYRLATSDSFTADCRLTTDDSPKALP